MKTAVVYYSLDGSTREAAKIIAQKLGADVFELEEVKQRSGKPLSFMAAAFGALAGKKSRLKDNPANSMSGYGTIYIGSPIWASRTVPAVNTFLCALKEAGKQINFFTVQADPNTVPLKGVQKLAERMKQRGATVGKMLCLHGERPGKTASKEHLAGQIEKQI
jgi:flavodoxin